MRRGIGVTVYVNTFFEEHLQQLLGLAGRVEAAFASAGLEYRVVGGLAVYLYVEEAAPDAGRLTKDIDILVRTGDLDAISKAVDPYGLERRDLMLVQKDAPSGRRAVHLIVEEELPPNRIMQGIRVAPLIQVVRMKLATFRAKDEMHLKDLDDAGAITAKVEATLSPPLLERLAAVRARA
jgi:hypothetical protein